MTMYVFYYDYLVMNVLCTTMCVLSFIWIQCKFPLVAKTFYIER